MLSSRVSILDCTSHTWRKAPSMLVKRKSPCFRVTDGKIYVQGGNRHNDCNSSSPWMEVFDPKTKTWEHVSERSAEFLSTGTTKIDTTPRCGCFVRNTYLNPIHYRWNIEFVKPRREMNWEFSSYCLIEDVIYGYGDGVFKWYDTKGTIYYWKTLERMPKIGKSSSFVKLMNYGGKIAVLWDKFVPSSGCKNRVIRCAVIALERRNHKEIYGRVEWCEIYGRVEWCDKVLYVPESCELVTALVATV